MNHRHVRPLVRFWWLLMIGAGIGLVAGVVAVAHVSLSAPPKVTYRARSQYTATEMVLVTSKTNPVVRTLVNGAVHQVKVQRSGAKSTQQTTTSPSSIVSQAPPQSAIQSLIYAANLYPHFITSDPVLALRLKMFGNLRGTVAAKAVNSVTTASGKYKSGNVPIIQVNATAGRPDKAIKLATSTVTAFATWLTRDQATSGVPSGQRVLISTLDKPLTAVASGGPKTTIAVLVAFVVLAVFLGLAFVLDKVPARETTAEALPLPGVLDQDAASNNLEPSMDGPSAPEKAPARRKARVGREAAAGSADSEELGSALAHELARSRTVGQAGGQPSAAPQVDG